jgi:hypothetical protein
MRSAVGRPGADGGALGLGLVAFPADAFLAGGAGAAGGLLVPLNRPSSPLVMLLNTCPTSCPTWGWGPMREELEGVFAAVAPEGAGPLVVLLAAPLLPPLLETAVLEAARSLAPLALGPG